MRFDASVPLSVSLNQASTIYEQAALMKEFEDLGFDGAGVADHLEHGRDAYITLALGATQTSRIKLYPSVTNPITRHPFALAGLANTMNEVAPGRFRLAIGSGDSTAIHTGVPPATVDRFREVVVAIQRLLAGKTVAFGHSPEERILDLTLAPPPVTITASGRRAIELAGEIGDGAHMLIGTNPSIIKAAWRHLENGAQKTGRSLKDFPVMYTAATVINDDLDAAREQVRGVIFRWLTQGLFNVGIKELGIEIPPVEKPADIPKDLLAQLSDNFLLVGSAQACVQQLQKLADDAGVDHVGCIIFGGMEQTRVFAREVMPHVT
jgi:alkanesulfonate monooxygenase SsuD/methylene tetrahydromethanopterin reductase-like flavin-dependent oxidoreductase (luciferase family)